MASTHIGSTELIGFAFDSSNFAMNSNTNWSQVQANHILLQEWGEDDERQEKEHRHVPEIDSDLEDATENKNQDEDYEEGHITNDDEFEQYMLGEDE